MSYLFTYKTFFDFYTNPNNLNTAQPPHNDLFYYPKEPFPPMKPKQKPMRKPFPSQFIVIDGIVVYVSLMKSKNDTNICDSSGLYGRNFPDDLLFSIPYIDSMGRYMDNHYHFGLTCTETARNKNKMMSIIFFHKTVQIDETAGKTHRNCL